MAKTEKLDLYKEHRADYVASKKAPALVDVSPARYLTVTGQGEPGGEEFDAKVGALYSVAFTIKMTRKFAGLGDYKVCQLEGLWWGPGEGDFFHQPRDQWCWKLLIRVPDFITSADLNEAKQALEAKGKPPEFNEVKLESIKEGPCVQMLHIGPYSAEGETIGIMQEFAGENAVSFHGRHHEIYLSDPRRVPPERLRTILRHPVRKQKAKS